MTLHRALCPPKNVYLILVNVICGNYTQVRLLLPVCLANLSNLIRLALTGAANVAAIYGRTAPENSRTFRLNRSFATEATVAHSSPKSLHSFETRPLPASQPTEAAETAAETAAEATAAAAEAAAKGFQCEPKLRRSSGECCPKANKTEKWRRLPLDASIRDPFPKRSAHELSEVNKQLLILLLPFRRAHNVINLCKITKIRQTLCK